MRISYSHISIPSTFALTPSQMALPTIVRGSRGPMRHSWKEEKTTCKHCGGTAVVERVRQTLAGQEPENVQVIRCDSAALTNSRVRTGVYAESGWRPKCPVYTIPG